jgi:hypothetical protein
MTKHESIDKDGRLQFQEWRDIPILDEKGDVVELHSIGRDRTELMTLRRSIEQLERMNRNLMSLCDHPVLIFDGEGNFVDMNESFQHQMLHGKKWSCLDDMFPTISMKRFKRLLERLSETGQMVYRVQFNDQVLGIKIRLLQQMSGKTRYLALFERSEQLHERNVLRTRLSKELILDGETVAFDLDSKTKKALQRQMHRVGKTNQVDRVYVFTFDDEKGVFDNILEWCGEDVEGHLDELQRIPQEDYPWWLKRLRKKQWIQVEDTHTLPRTASHEQALLMAQDIRAILVAPLERNGEVIGFIGFDQNHTKRVWHSQEVEALREFKESIEAVLSGILGDSLNPAK